MFESIPDPDHDLTPRICRAKFHSVGKGLPCIHTTNPSEREMYSKLNVADPYDNIGSVVLPRFCPRPVATGADTAYQFRATVYYDIPLGQTFAGTLEG